MAKNFKAAGESLVAKTFLNKVMNLILNEATLNLTGKVLHRRSGRLVGALFVKVEETKSAVTGRIGINNVFYGKIWELTGHKAYTFGPVTKKALAFGVGPYVTAIKRGPPIVVRKSVNIPAVGPKPFIAPAIQKLLPTLESEHKKAFLSVLTKIHIDQFWGKK